MSGRRLVRATGSLVQCLLRDLVRVVVWDVLRPKSTAACY
jgi:hypothetical protein